MQYTPLWWNGRHRGLKIRWGQLRTGSSPVSGTRTGIPHPGYPFVAFKASGFIFYTYMTLSADSLTYRFQNFAQGKRVVALIRQHCKG